MLNRPVDKPVDTCAKRAARVREMMLNRRINHRLLTRWEKDWLEQVFEAGVPGITARNGRVFLSYVKCGSFGATGRYLGVSGMAVKNHVMRVLRAFNKLNQNS